MPRQSSKPTIEMLQAELASPDHKIRKNAVTRMTRYYRAQAVEPLLGMLQDGRGPVRAKTVQVLTRLNDPRTYTPIRALLADKNMSVRAQVVKALGHFGDRSVVPLLLSLLSDPKIQLRQAAMMSLGKLRDPRALPPLLTYLAQAKSDELYYVARALSDFDDPCVISPLLTCVERQNVSFSMCWTIADALGRMGEQTLAYAMPILADQTKRAEARMCIALALGQKPRPAFLQLLIAALGDPHAKVRLYAAQALAKLNDSCAIDPLLTLLADDDEFVCAQAIESLMKLKAENVSEKLIPCLSSPYERVVSASAKALGQMRDPAALTPLLDTFLQDRFGHCANSSLVEALCAFNDSSVVEPLIQRLPTSSHRLRWHIVRVLGHFNSPLAVEPLLALLDPTVTNYFEQKMQEKIMETLGRIGDLRTVESLLPLYNQASASLRDALQRTLIALGAHGRASV